MELLIIVPAYNEEENIKPLIIDLIDHYPQYDYIIINDGSTDQTLEICKQNRFKVIDLSVNLGLSGCFQTGMKYAYKHGYDYAIQFDGDGQHVANYIDRLLEAQKRENADIVIGSRYMGHDRPSGLRGLGCYAIRFAIQLTTKNKIADPTSGMRLYSKDAIREFSSRMNYGPEPDTIAYLINSGYTVVEEAVTMNERINGNSYLSLKNSILYMIKMIFSIFVVQWFRRKR